MKKFFANLFGSLTKEDINEPKKTPWYSCFPKSKQKEPELTK